MRYFLLILGKCSVLKMINRMKFDAWIQEGCALFFGIAVIIGF